MARMPGASWRPLPTYGTPMARFDIVCVHTMVGSLAGTDAYFRGHSPGGTNSHFGTGSDGTIWQWVDTAHRSAANLNGNHHIISIENADYGVGFPKWNTNDGGAVPAFTDAQVEANAKILAWAHKTYGIPLELIPDSKPGRRGIGYHRQGVPGYMVSGGERWSNAVGKVCPGNRRIAQIPQIIARAKQIAGGAAPVEVDVPLSAAEKNEIADLTVKKLLAADVSDAYSGTQSFKNVLSQVWTNSRADLAQGAAMSAAQAKIAAAVANDDLTADELKAVVRDALAESVVQVDVNVSGGDEPQPPPAA